MPRSAKKLAARRERRVALPEAVPKDGKAGRGRTTATTTPLAIRAHGVAVTAATRAFARERAGFNLSKFALYVERVTLYLEDLSGPVGAPLVACRAVIAASRLEPIVVETTSADVRDAIERTLERSERTLRRAVERIERRKTRG